jgi:hypothetical protein
MAQTTFTGPVKSNNGFQGDIVGNITGNVTGNLTGNVTGNVTGKLTGQVQDSYQSLSGAGAANLTTASTFCTSTGAGNVVTLANGTAGQAGLRKTIVHTTKGASGTIVVTPATASGFTTVTLTNVGSAVTLMYTGAAWVVVSTNGGTIA